MYFVGDCYAFKSFSWQKLSTFLPYFTVLTEIYN